MMRLKFTRLVMPAVSRSGRKRTGPHAAARIGGTETGGFTLVEVVISTAIVALIFGGVITAYIQAGKRIEWTGYSLAAQSLAVEVVEQVKSATWDPAQTPPVNNLTNLNLQGTSYNAATLTYTGHTTAILDVPYSDSNSVLATLYVTVQMFNVGSSTNVQAQFVRVDSVWPYTSRGPVIYFTNTLCTIIAPDNRSSSAF